MTVFKREIISQSVNTVKNISNCFFFLRNIRNAVRILAVSQAGNFLIYPAARMQI